MQWQDWLLSVTGNFREGVRQPRSKGLRLTQHMVFYPAQACIDSLLSFDIIIY